MIQPKIRVPLAFSFFLLTAGTLANGHAQTTTTGKGGVSTNGTTGTDPCPKGYICTVGTPPSSSSQVAGPTSQATTNASAAGLAQALMTLLGLN